MASHVGAANDSACCSGHDHSHAHDHAHPHNELLDEDVFVQALVDAFQDTANTLTHVRELLALAPPAYVDLCDSDGRTALFLAVYSGRLDLVQLLLDAGASPHASAESVMVLACMGGDLAIVRALYLHGARIHNEYIGPHISPLYAACKMGHFDVVQWLVHHGAWLDDVDDDGATPFMVAAGYARLRIVQLLASMGASVQRATPSGLSTAYYAAYSGHVRLLEFFLTQRIALRDADGNPSNLLDAAVRGDQLRVATYLLETVNLADEHIDASLGVAVERQNGAMVALLIQHDADVEALDNNGVSPLYAAAHYGDAAVAQALIGAGADLMRMNPSTGYTPVHEMALRGHAELLALARALKPETDFRKASRFDVLTPLHLAASNDHAAAVRFLIGAIVDQQAPVATVSQTTDGVDVRGPRGQTPLILAAENGCLEPVRLLLAAGADVNARTGSGLTALIGAAYVGALDVVELLCAHGADVDLATHAGVTALHAAAQYGHVRVVEYLLETCHALADLTWTGTRCVVAGAVMNGHLEVLFVLAAHGAALDYSSGAFLSPLFLAAQYKQLAVVQLLVLATGVDVNAVNTERDDNDGFAADSTPLMVAAQRGYVDIVACLCGAGADVELRNRDGHSALDLARLNLYHKAVAYLENHTAASH